jgi:uncharacterized membrane protein
MSADAPPVRPVDRRPSYGTFVAWLAVGAGACLALLTALTIGPLVLVAVVVATVLLVRRPGSVDAAMTGLMCGVGALLLCVAFLNRHGPGDYCETSATEQTCSTQWSPWPWLVVGVLLVAGGVLLFRRAVRAPAG